MKYSAPLPATEPVIDGDNLQPPPVVSKSSQNLPRPNGRPGSLLKRSHLIPLRVIYREDGDGIYGDRFGEGLTLSVSKISVQRWPRPEPDVPP
jgi:hypothetical protein